MLVVEREVVGIALVMVDKMVSGTVVVMMFMVMVED